MHVILGTRTQFKIFLKLKPLLRPKFRLLRSTLLWQFLYTFFLVSWISAPLSDNRTYLFVDDRINPGYPTYDTLRITKRKEWNRPLATESLRGSSSWSMTRWPHWHFFSLEIVVAVLKRYFAKSKSSSRYFRHGVGVEDQVQIREELLISEFGRNIQTKRYSDRW